jgi:hypothetical protein
VSEDGDGAASIAVPVPVPVPVPVLGRAAAATGVACVAVHVATAVGGGHGGALHAAVSLAMAAACVPCGRPLWRGPDLRVWRATGLMYGGMLFVHLLLLTAAHGRPGHAGHLAGAGQQAGWTWTGTGMWVGLLLAAVQVAVAGTALATSRIREQQLAGHRAGLPARCTDVVHSPSAR